MRRINDRQAGLTLLELLMVVAIIGILAAIVVANSLVALDKARQRKTMADIRSIATAWEAFATDRGAYAAAGQSVFVWPSSVVTQTDLEKLIAPTYIRPMARLDGWGFPLQYAIEVPTSPSDGAVVYGIRSAGRDGIFETEYPESSTTRFECDIVFSNGQFVVMPRVR